jgi:hypothetical protein
VPCEREPSSRRRASQASPGPGSRPSNAANRATSTPASAVSSLGAALAMMSHGRPTVPCGNLPEGLPATMRSFAAARCFRMATAAGLVDRARGEATGAFSVAGAPRVAFGAVDASAAAVGESAGIAGGPSWLSTPSPSVAAGAGRAFERGPRQGDAPGRRFNFRAISRSWMRVTRSRRRRD